MQHEESKSQEVQPGQRLRQARIIACQAPKPGGPGKTALHDPAARQEDTPFLGLRQLDHLQTEALLCRRFQRLVSRVALVHESHFHRVARYRRSLGRQVGDLRPVLLAGRCDPQRQQVAQRIHRPMPFAPFAPCGPIVPGSRAAFRTD